MAIWINGICNDQINVSDRGLCYGDGLFETIAVTRSRPQLLEEHFRRLKAGLIKLDFPSTILPLIKVDLDKIPLNGQQTLKIIITRGVGQRGYALPHKASATRIITLSDRAIETNKPQTGISVRFCNYRLPLNPTLAQVKHLNRLDQIMARNEWQDPQISEGIMLDTEGFIIEGTMSNIFWFNSTKNEIQTPLIDRCGVKGVMRDHLITLLEKEQIKYTKGRFLPSELIQADEAFICNSLIGIWPINKINNKSYQIGSVTRRLQTILNKEAESG